MAVVRTVALVANKGTEGCWGYELAYDSQVDLATVRLGVDDTVRVVGGRVADDLRRPLAEVVAVAEQEATSDCGRHQMIERPGPAATPLSQER